MEMRIGLTVPLPEHVEPDTGGHVGDHAIINRFINDLDECTICGAVVRSPKATSHYAGHVGAAIGAR